MTSFRSFREQTIHYISREPGGQVDGPVSYPTGWKPADFDDDSPEWLKQLTADQIGEIGTAVDHLRSEGVEMESISRDNFQLPSLFDDIQQWREEIRSGRGFVVVRGLPVDEWGVDKSAFAYWGIGHHLGIPGAQNPQNELLGHVVDYGEEKDNANVRRYRTSGNIDFHCDMADVVGLMCLHTAKSGGQSRIASSITAFNELSAREPAVASRLFEPFFLDRRGEEKEGERGYFPITPCVWSEDKGLQTFYHSEYFRSAERHDDIDIDDAAKRVLDLYDEICASSDVHLDMWLEKGDMQFISNHSIVHARTEYEDWPEKDRKRHLLRLWLSL